jgi:hypothetical protein
MATQVLETALGVAVMVSTTINVALFAFRPDSYRTTPPVRRLTEFITVVWVILLPVAGAFGLGLGATGLASGQRGAWQGVVTGGVALGCWPVVILAVRKRGETCRNP